METEKREGFRSRRLMWLNEDRVLYLGLHGTPGTRTFGAYSLYASLVRPHRVRLDRGEWQQAELSVIPPFVPYEIECGDRMICSVLIERETVEVARLPAFLRCGRGVVFDPAALTQIRNTLDQLKRGAGPWFENTTAFDACFFGQRLPRRDIDPRILASIDRIKRAPDSPITAESCAEAAGLSASRFLRLFKDQTDVSFRSFRTWQRARSVLYHVTQDNRLSDVALNAGYPDSTHFSHSVRQFYGLTPSSIFSGSRRMNLVDGSQAGAERATLGVPL